jgi:hypothetical protein
LNSLPPGSVNRLAQSLTIARSNIVGLVGADLHQHRRVLQEFGDEGDELLQIGADAVDVLDAGEDCDVGVVVVAEAHPPVGELAEVLEVERIARLRAVDGDGDDVVGLLGEWPVVLLCVLGDLSCCGEILPRPAHASPVLAPSRAARASVRRAGMSSASSGTIILVPRACHWSPPTLSFTSTAKPCSRSAPRRGGARLVGEKQEKWRVRARKVGARVAQLEEHRRVRRGDELGVRRRRRRAAVP